MKRKIYLGIVIFIIATLSLVGSLPVIFIAEDTATLLFGISLVPFALAMYSSLIIPPVLLVNTLLGAKINLDNSKTEIADDFKNMSEAERNDLALSVLQDMQERLPQTEDENGETRYNIFTGKDAILVKRTIEYLINKIQPTDSGIVECIESYASYYKRQMSRGFVGARTVLVLMIVFAALITVSATSIGAGIAILAVLGIYIAFYYYSAKRPFYLLEKDARIGKQFDSSLISQTIKSIWAPNPYKTIHHDEQVDGRTGEVLERKRNYGRELGDEATSFGVNIILSVIVSVIAVGLTPIYTIYYFCSNYWGNCLSPFKNTDKWIEEQYIQLASNKAQ
jgi:hypothetical protein